MNILQESKLKQVNKDVFGFLVVVGRNKYFFVFLDSINAKIVKASKKKKSGFL
jgi:hypothetical protein